MLPGLNPEGQNTMTQDEALDILLQLIPNAASGQVPIDQAKTEVIKISQAIRDDDDWNYITGEIEHTLKPGSAGPDPQQYQTWLRIQDKERGARCAAMRQRAAAELGLFPRR